MDRIFEPELMEDPAQVRAYAAADFSQENQGFVDRFREYFPIFPRGTCSIWVVVLAIFPSASRRRFPLVASPPSMRRSRWYGWLKKLCSGSACPGVSPSAVNDFRISLDQYRRCSHFQ